MKIAIVYFSQTGNTRKIAETLAREFEICGHETTCASITKVKMECILESDLIGVGSPTFESHAPRPIKDFITSLPTLLGKRAFAFATCGGASGTVLSDLAKLLKAKNAEVLSGFLALGEVHHPAPCIIGKSKDHPNETDFDHAKRFALAISHRVGSHSEIEYHGLKAKTKFYSLVGRITSSGTLIRLLEPEPKLDSSKCRKCQRCVRECPIGNITMNPYPVLGDQCIRCYRCLNVCKTQSYSANWWLGNAVVFALWNEHFMRWLGEYGKGD